ncbi:uncharacterized protein LOC128894148 [Hylaeus anthracinus]|uniref:uncharacterized protein LOC128894148 n=1 Tax=Hylaeus anthracinus TaxID=313031 RepID=UPI0023B91DCC|nr:uncharacterized protein LOC128894148 [Hylaeus anthracinus]
MVGSWLFRFLRASTLITVEANGRVRPCFANLNFCELVRSAVILLRCHNWTTTLDVLRGQGVLTRPQCVVEKYHLWNQRQITEPKETLSSSWSRGVFKRADQKSSPGALKAGTQRVSKIVQVLKIQRTAAARTYLSLPNLPDGPRDPKAGRRDFHIPHGRSSLGGSSKCPVSVRHGETH